VAKVTVVANLVLGDQRDVLKWRYSVLQGVYRDVTLVLRA
jgi:hypothetical protein